MIRSQIASPQSGPRSGDPGRRTAEDATSLVERRFWTWILVLSAVAFLIRAAFALAMPSAPRKDAAEYHALALHLVGGEGYIDSEGRPTAFRPPGLPLLLAVVYRMTGPDPVAARLALALAGAALVPLLAALTRRIAGARAALIAGLMAALYPPFCSSYFSPRSLLAEVPLTTWSVLALWLAASAAARNGPVGARGLALAAGVAAGCAALTRGTLLFLPPLLLAYLCVAASGTAMARLRVALALLLGTGATLLPWTVRNYQLFGEFVPISTNGGVSLWASYNPRSRGLGNGPDEGYWEIMAEDRRLQQEQELDEVERSRHFTRLAWLEARSRPGRALRLVLRKFLLFWDPTLKDWSQDAPSASYNWGYALMLPLAALGACWLGGKHAAPAGLAALLLVFAGLLTSLHVLLHVDVRYRVTIEAVLLIFAATALASLPRRLGRRALIGASAAYLLLHAAIGWSYAKVLLALSAIVNGLGLGLRP